MPRDVLIRRAVYALAVLAVVGLMVVATRRSGIGDSDTEVAGRSEIESIEPARGAEALQQDRVGVDLAPGWTGVLQINGQEVPEDQTDRSEPLNQVFFRPGTDKVYDAYPPGENCVVAVLWMLSQGRDQSTEFRWCFSVL